MKIKILAALLNLTRRHENKYKIGQIDDTKFIYQIANSTEMMKNGILVAGSVVRFVIGHIEAKVVLMDENFDKFDDECKKFIIYHELGHLNNHFTDEILASYHSMTYYDRLLLEHEADMNGVKNTSVDACLKTLEQLKDILNEKGFKDRTITDRKILLKARAIKVEE